jgi:hypothetical protein
MSYMTIIPIPDQGGTFQGSGTLSTSFQATLADYDLVFMVLSGAANTNVTWTVTGPGTQIVEWRQIFNLTLAGTSFLRCWLLHPAAAASGTINISRNSSGTNWILAGWQTYRNVATIDSGRVNNANFSANPVVVDAVDFEIPGSMFVSGLMFSSAPAANGAFIQQIRFPDEDTRRFVPGGNPMWILDRTFAQPALGQTVPFSFTTPEGTPVYNRAGWRLTPREAAVIPPGEGDPFTTVGVIG